MEFKKLMQYIEENQEEHFDELIKENENAIKEIDKKMRRKQILKKQLRYLPKNYQERINIGFKEDTYD